MCSTNVSPLIELKTKFQLLGCNEQNADVAAHLFVKLKKHMTDIEYFFSEKFQKIYIKAKENEISDVKVFLPFLVTDTLSFSLLEELNSFFSETLVTLAFFTSGTRFIFYEISNGIGDPPGLNDIPRKVRRQMIKKSR